MTKTKKMFRELLNREDTLHFGNFAGNINQAWTHNNGQKQYGQRTRLYGDYLYSQDRAMFNMLYQEWVNGSNMSDFGLPNTT